MEKLLELKKMYTALQEALTNPNIFTVALLDKQLRKYHKGVAFAQGIPTSIGQWFRELLTKHPVIEQQRDCVEVFMKLVETKQTNKFLRECIDSESMAPLFELAEKIKTKIAELEADTKPAEQAEQAEEPETTTE